MRLDNLGVKIVPGSYDRTKDDRPKVEFDRPLSLCDGLFSGAGPGSFRDKVYDPIIVAIAGEECYTDILHHSTVAQTASCLENADTEKLRTLPDIRPIFASKEEFRQENTDHQRPFRPYADTEHLRTIPLIQQDHSDHQHPFRPSADTGACLSASHLGVGVMEVTLTDQQLAPIWGKGIQVGTELVPISLLMSLINLAFAVDEDARADGRCDIHPHVQGLGFTG